jgi:hypothetical protein
MTKKENPTNDITLFQNVAGHTSSKRVLGILLLLIGAALLSYNIMFGIHIQTAAKFSEIVDAISIFFVAGTSLLGVSVVEYLGKLNPFKK